MTMEITVPGGIAFAGFYYPEILLELLLDLRQRRGELGLTDENDFETHVQYLRSFALVGHLNNTRLDSVATELLIGTATLLESVKRIMRLIGVELSSASPAVAPVLLKLSAVTSVSQTGFVTELAEFTTETVPPIPYEHIEDGGTDLDRTDQVSYVFGLEKTKSGVCQVSTAASDVIRRTSGSTFASGDLFGHVFIPEGIAANGGEFRIVEVIDADNVRVVRVPGSADPSFQDETGLSWTLRVFTTDYATKANTDADPFSPLSTPEVGDMILVAHKQVIPTQVDAVITTPAADIAGVWEYYDTALSKFKPTVDPVDNLDGTLTFNVNALLGAANAAGAQVVVEYTPTGITERVTSVWSGGVNQITTLTYLGQTAPSTDLDDYRLTADWIPFENQDDSIADWTTSDYVDWNLPQNLERSWLPTEVNLYEAMWFRYRIVTVGGGPTGPSIDRIRIDQGDQYLLIEATQGETIGPEILGGSSGAAFQEFTLPSTPFIDDTETVEVDESGGGNWQEYVRTSNFLNSNATSRHYVREVNAEDVALIRFGDGINGKIPPAGTDNVRATYRVGADTNGNVGVDEITINADGLSGIAEVRNPRAAAGWRIKDGGTDADIIRVKRDKPAELRSRNTASHAGDVKLLAVNQFVDENGTKPVARAVTVEEGLGLKTIKLLVVGTDGNTLTASQRSDLETYFNGDRYARPQVSGVITANQQVTVFNYEPRLITVSTTVTWAGGNAESIRAALLALLHPLALEEDGTTFVFDFDGYVSLSRVYSAIHNVDPAIEDVPTLLLNGAAASLKLGANELPVTTAGSIQVSVQS
jgi:hypothetical protein